MSDDIGDEMFAEVLGREERRFSAYHFVLDPTGEPSIDLILASVATAGKASHSTEMWSDHWDEGETSPTYVDLIQTAAKRAADEIKALRAALANERKWGDSHVCPIHDHDA